MLPVPIHGRTEVLHTLREPRDNCEREIHGVSYFPAMCHDVTVTMETISASSKNEEWAEVRPCFLDEAVTDMAWQVSTSSCTPDLISPPGLASGVESP